MPGFIPHFIAGNAMFLIGSYFIQKYTSILYNHQNKIFLYIVCILSSIIPDFPLGFFYLFNFGTFESLVSYHAQLHLIISPLATISFIILASLNAIKKQPIWIIGLLCIFLHIFMDATIHEIGVWF